MLLKKMKTLIISNQRGSKKKQGTLMSYNPRKGCGFIRSKKTGEKIFVLFTELNGKIERGDRVLFDTYDSPLGRKARNVELENA